MGDLAPVRGDDAARSHALIHRLSWMDLILTTTVHDIGVAGIIGTYIDTDD